MYASVTSPEKREKEIIVNPFWSLKKTFPFNRKSAFLFVDISHILCEAALLREPRLQKLTWVWRLHGNSYFLLCFPSSDFINEQKTDEFNTRFKNIRGLEIWKWRGILRVSVGFGLGSRVFQVRENVCYSSLCRAAEFKVQLKFCGIWLAAQKCAKLHLTL